MASRANFPSPNCCNFRIMLRVYIKRKKRILTRKNTYIIQNVKDLYSIIFHRNGLRTIKLF